MTAHARRHRPRPGVILLVMLTALVLTVLLGLRACRLFDEGPAPESAPAGTAAGSIVSLGDGRTMVAARGTVAADLVDWLASGQNGERYFEAGGQEFVGNSADLAPESWNRVDRFAMMLQANHDVRVRLIGYSDASGNATEDQRLSEARARAVMRELSARGIARSRLSVEGRGAANPVADNATLSGRARNRRIAVILSRGR